MSVTVDVQYACAAEGLPSTTLIVTWVRAALADRRSGCELTVRVVDECEAAVLNSRYRQKPGATNVLSFPFEAPTGVDLALLGDVVVCAPVLAREALAQGKDLRAHWAHIVVHGTLHLLGDRHDTPDAAMQMEARETAILHTLGFPDPYREPLAS